MRNIYFRLDEELIYFCEILFRKQDEIYVQWKRDKDWGNKLLLTKKDCNEKTIFLCFVEVIMFYRLNRIIKKIAHDYYYYTDVDEIERICQLTNWVLTEKHYASYLFPEDKTVNAYLLRLLKSNMEPHQPIYFDSVVTFSMKPFIECLKQAVGYGMGSVK